MRKTSANDILLYELCPQKWVFVKSRKKELKQLYAFYRFSSALHDAVKKHMEGDRIEDAFEAYWLRYRGDYPLIYKPGETWQTLCDLGLKLAADFRRLFNSKNLEPVLMEQKLDVHFPDIVYTIQPDLICQDTEGNFVTVESKTTEEPLMPAWVTVSDQLSGQALAIHENLGQAVPVRVIVNNFVKTGQIGWIEGIRSQYQLDEYKRKIDFYAGLMGGKFHPRRPLYAFSSPCKWCDFVKECHSGRSVESFVRI